MASSAKSTSSDPVARVAAELRAALFPGAHLVLGLSGGVDSVSLLAILSELAPRLQFSLRAVHVHHGISPNAEHWASFCESLCRTLGIPLAVERVDIHRFRGLGLEGAARAARYEAFAGHDADFLVLAQHRDDQAETLLLQLLRGAGVRGLAGMPPLRKREGSSPRHGVLRPLLATARAELEAFARDRGLEWIEDESNSSSTLDRNFVRLQVLPLIEQRYAHARAALARSSSHLREADLVLDEVGREDAARVDTGDGLDVRELCALGHARAKNMLRAYCREAGRPVPGGAVLEELWTQASTAREDASPRIDVEGWSFRRYRGRLYMDRARADEGSESLASSFSTVWQGENSLPLLALGGVLKFKPEEGRGLSLERLGAAPVTVRLRRGGERLRLHGRGPHRTLKNLFQEHGVPPWRRDRLPLVYCGESLVAVPGLGEADEWRAKPGERGLIVTWEML